MSNLCLKSGVLLAATTLRPFLMRCPSRSMNRRARATWQGGTLPNNPKSLQLITPIIKISNRPEIRRPIHPVKPIHQHHSGHLQIIDLLQHLRNRTRRQLVVGHARRADIVEGFWVGELHRHAHLTVAVLLLQVVGDAQLVDLFEVDLPVGVEEVGHGLVLVLVPAGDVAFAVE
jgi:hypothetical protein